MTDPPEPSPPVGGPTKGDVCLGCIHRPDPRVGAHWYYVHAMEFRPPGGDLLIAQWIFVCRKCFEKFGQDLKPWVERGEVRVNHHIVVEDGIVFDRRPS
jgi:hypothetical protein